MTTVYLSSRCSIKFLHFEQNYKLEVLGVCFCWVIIMKIMFCMPIIDGKIQLHMELYGYNMI